MPKPRSYLDWNASAPLRAEARSAMLAAMDVISEGGGNPSSVHAEGRRARAIVEKARAQVATLVGAKPEEVVFTSGATEAAALALSGAGAVCALPIEHDAVLSWADRFAGLAPDGTGEANASCAKADILCWQRANSETGVLQEAPAVSGPRILRDYAQAAGRIPVRFDADYGLLSAHKLGGPQGVGALLIREGLELAPVIRGGGQEKGRRPGTENVIGIAGFGAAAEAAGRDLDSGFPERAAKLRIILESMLEASSPDIIIVGETAPRLPNTSCLAISGWPGETQVMALDLAGFAISAGSACSSGKVERASRVLMAMGFDETTASSAIRVSLGPDTTEAEVMAFADAWRAACGRRRAKAA